jgi:subtilisin-like proprotein convertase family protein
MQRLQYRNFGNFETLVGSWTVNAVVAPAKHAAVRWFELRRNTGAGSWGLRQEGTYAPDSDHRFMPSISMDASENIAIGYSVTSDTTFPSIRYTVHDASVDPLGTMEPEAEMIAGAGSQTGTAGRWGDYSSMDVDPVDNCTFWFTSEFYSSTSQVDWETQIGSFKVPTCTNFLLSATEASLEVCKADDTATYNLSISDSYVGTTNMTFADCPAGAGCGFSTNPIINPGNTTDFNLTNLTNVAAGNHVITATATDSVEALDTDDLSLNLFLYGTTPGTPNLITPADSSYAPSFSPELTWSAVSDGQDYLVEVDDDEFFGSIDFSTTVSAGLTSASASGLNPESCYYWRVSPTNLCGAGTTSGVYEFFTGAVSNSNDLMSVDVPHSIDTVPVNVESTLTVAGVGTINDVNLLDLGVTHTWVGDLAITLTSPEGTTVVLMSQSDTNSICGELDDISISLDDEAAPGAWPCSPTGNGGTYQPSNPLSAFDGENADGVWTLTVVDGFNGDGGSLDSWGLNFESITNVGNYCGVIVQYTVGGNLSGLSGGSVTLQNNSGDDIVIGADGPFTFSPQNDGTGFNVTVSSSPVDQTCEVANGIGNVNGGDVTNVTVTCSATPEYTVGGNVTGLVGTVTLQNNSGDDQIVSVDGGFTFTQQYDETTYDVTVSSQPNTGETCTVTNGSGTVSGSNVVDVTVNCSFTNQYCFSTPTAIPDNDPNGVSTTINIPDTGTISNVTVSANVDHTYIFHI